MTMCFAVMTMLMMLGCAAKKQIHSYQLRGAHCEYEQGQLAQCSCDVVDEILDAKSSYTILVCR